MKIGFDGILLGAWASIENSQSVLDIGTGTGLVALMLAQRSESRPSCSIHALECDEGAYSEAMENFGRSDWSNRITGTLERVQEFTVDEKFDAVVCNPPYFARSLSNESRRRTLARHDVDLTFECLLSNVERVLADEGVFSVIIPARRELELLSIAEQVGLHHTGRLLRVRTTPRKEVSRILLELGRKKRSQLMEAELTIELERHQYSPEFRDLCRDFYLSF